ncbi:hypothetical protein CBL_10752 [Carabus blaptoides fortunei]
MAQSNRSKVHPSYGACCGGTQGKDPKNNTLFQPTSPVYVVLHSYWLCVITLFYDAWRYHDRSQNTAVAVAVSDTPGWLRSAILFFLPLLLIHLIRVRLPTIRPFRRWIIENPQLFQPFLLQSRDSTLSDECTNCLNHRATTNNENDEGRLNTLVMLLLMLLFREVSHQVFCATGLCEEE